ncbi:MAG: signal recognition particle protein [Acidobacteriota bacterium]|jgi:signal recognition particle subunit SRP54|nr:signal recognition particle protein [Acidobacteriota bacterium]
MLDNLSGRLTRVMRYLKGEAKVTDENMKQALREIRLSLLEADVNYLVVKEFIANVRERAMGQEVRESLTPYQQVVKIVQAELTRLLGETRKELARPQRKPGVIMLVGLQGTGKTTTAGKLARFIKHRGDSVLLSSLDPKRLAAADQLETVAREVGAPCHRAAVDLSLERQVPGLLREARETGYDYLIADTAGRLHVDATLMQELAALKQGLNPVEVLFVGDALTGQDAVESARRFNEAVGITGIILTKMDADARGGAALSMVSATGKPIMFLGTGEKADDLQPFHPDRLAAQILGMGDVLSLIERAEEELDQREAERVAQRMLRNEFTLEDFAAQLEQMTRLGSMKDILGMLPQMGGKTVALQGAELDDKSIAHMIAIIRSMTPEERSRPKLINGRRRMRIARGAGRSVQEVNRLLKGYLEMRKTMGKPLFRRMMKRFDISQKMR